MRWNAHQLAYGGGDDRRLFVLAAGNIRDGMTASGYPDNNDLAEAENPSQAWNALVAGAYTDKTTISHPDYEGWEPLAPAGELCPTSRTSGVWDRQWPIRPDVVFEGGNQAHDGINAPVPIDDLQLLTTHYRPTQRLLDTFGETSAATALAARLSAQIMASRPELWRETVRGSVVHAAEWTRVMRRHIDQAGSQAQKMAMLRRYGWGVPTWRRALYSATNDATLMVEDALLPFRKDGSAVKTRKHEPSPAALAPVQALIDAGSVSLTGGSIALHDESGIPLRSLGLGSSRLLIAALQRKAAVQATTFLIDELEYGLEPHRIIRLLGALGAKEEPPPLQVFATSHSPTAVAELGAHQLQIARMKGGEHIVMRASDAGDVQGTIRAHAHALLATSILVCEGASEIGLMRGLDQHFTGTGQKSLPACGAALVNGNGDETFSRANAFQSLGYRVAILRDSDKPAPALAEAAFLSGGGWVFAWGGGRALEQELFAALPDGPAAKLLDLAIEAKDRSLVEAHIGTLSRGVQTLDALETEALIDGLSADSRAFLGNAAARFGWLKTITTMEIAGRTIVGPAYRDANASLTGVIDGVVGWVVDGSR